jgi:hypothetical protein
MKGIQEMTGRAIVLKATAVVFSLLLLQGCTTAMVAGAVVGTAAAVAVEVAEVPFKVGGAVVDVVSDDDGDD